MVVLFHDEMMRSHHIIRYSLSCLVSCRISHSGVLVSRTVKDLVAGSGLEFVDRGVQTLKGVPGDWPLFAVRR